MSTSLLYHAFGVRGYEWRSTEYAEGGVTMTIEPPRQTCWCSQCGGRKVHSKVGVTREFRSLPIGGKPVRLRMRAVDENRAARAVSDMLRGSPSEGRVRRSEEVVHAVVRTVRHRIGGDSEAATLVITYASAECEMCHSHLCEIYNRCAGPLAVGIL